jgi:hypothetical protein
MVKSDYINIKEQTHILPKCYGDLFESVGAAILIDGG